jgi:hypothetical protein
MGKRKVPDIDLTGSVWYRKRRGRVLHLFTRDGVDESTRQQKWKSLCGSQNMRTFTTVAGVDLARTRWSKCDRCSELHGLVFAKNPKMYSKITGDDWDSWWDD